MVYRILADLVVVIHLMFILFVVLGGLLVIKWRWFACLHLPALMWGGLVEFTGWICPLTPLENCLRKLGGDAGYETGFIVHYLVPIIYPEGLTRMDQTILGFMLVLINICIYLRVWRRHIKA